MPFQSIAMEPVQSPKRRVEDELSAGFGVVGFIGELELAIAPLLTTCAATTHTPPPKYKIRRAQTVPANVKLREGLRKDDVYDLSVNLRTKLGVHRQLPSTPAIKHKYFFTDSEVQSEEEQQQEHSPQAIEGNEIFRFDLQSTVRSSSIGNKMPLIRSLTQLRKFKTGLTPHKKVQMIDEHLDKQPGGAVREVTPQLRSYRSEGHLPPGTPKEAVVKANNKKAVALSRPTTGIEQPVMLNARDARSYDATAMPGPLNAIRHLPVHQMDSAPLLDMALMQSEFSRTNSDSMTIDSYREEQREKFLQHNIRSADSEESLQGALAHSASLHSQRSRSAEVKTPILGGAVVRRAKKYAQDGEELLRPLTSTSSKQDTSYPRVDATLAEQQKYQYDASPVRQDKKIKSKYTDPFKAPLRCVTCYKAAELWCTQCVHAYCIICWNRIPHHALFDPTSAPDGRVQSASAGRRKIVNTNEQSMPKKSYSSTVLFGQYPAPAKGRGNTAPAPVPQEFDFFPDPMQGKKVYLENDGSVKLTAFDDELDGYSACGSRPASRGRSPPSRRRPRSQGEVGTGALQEVTSSIHYAPTHQADPLSRAENVVVRRSSDKRPTSPSFAAGRQGNVAIAYTKRPSAAAHAIVGISRDFQPVDWRAGLFQAKDPLGIANKHALIDPDGLDGQQTAIFAGVPVRLLKSR